MADPSHADVLLKLYELRTEATLRQARAWFVFEFHPTSAQDVLAVWLGPGHLSAPFRMVTTYWTWLRRSWFRALSPLSCSTRPIRSM